MSSALVIGEALMDVVTTTPDGAPHIKRHPGGSPANVALGLARLDVTTRLLTSLARDAFGRMIAAHLQDSGVSIVTESFGAERTSSAVATIRPGGSADYDFDVVWQLPDGPAVPPADIVHTGSIAAFLQPGAEQVFQIIASRPESLVSFDPNIRPSLVPDRARVSAQFERFAGVSQVVKLSDEDASWLYPGRELDAVRHDLFDSGVQLVAVTLGAEGSMLSTREHSVSIAALSGVQGDTIGAGDSYMAALLAGILKLPADSGGAEPAGAERLAGLRMHDLESLARFAASAAAVTVSRNGADLPHSADLAEFARSI
ncbi:carbohydrate kinase family protein [Subtercola sp. YIM 133946]|uniref:carbohydrate kinase family protein n=1 Tax=Subtercola sp. YIM 133946 TaxID=3118909 RepID=UPI002F94DC96